VKSERGRALRWFTLNLKTSAQRMAGPRWESSIGCHSNIAGDIRYLGMRLVVDTAVMVAAIRSDTGASRHLLVASLERRFTMLASVP
jgi:hypothetical protein